ncbi:hypothetical protein EFV37_25205 [Mesorhizobium loti]|uniref:Uncharacterized protein n=2 Tax=Mesorhizobium TaxID=68287 RepID=A0A6M7XDG8_RHILI|nr:MULTISPECIES: hypothetical protein [Mesorhizobium]OBQ68383.1 hypothetical protein A9K72_09010 [Mesorhizobium loti]OBQ72367.1 hypothetical protein A8145_06025 [Mesorhizobium loti]QKC65198.1 hypothetical protein EB229_25200 [Mesorhizobium jarvisii]QKC72029.1 hypothetical protein EB815_24935 [Mesorhizobium loti]QKD11113.1 hypothetical protein EFV37_25205 [Mesorhizobium loti]
MTLKDHLVKVATTYAAEKGLSLSRVSTIVFGDGKVLDRLQGTADLTTSRFEAAMLWFSNNWPADLAWPDGVTRPISEAA